jgi:hypothetical protein
VFDSTDPHTRSNRHTAPNGNGTPRIQKATIIDGAICSYIQPPCTIESTSHEDTGAAANAKSQNTPVIEKTDGMNRDIGDNDITNV